MNKSELKKSAIRTVYPPIIYGLKKFSISNYDISKQAIFVVIHDEKTESFDCVRISEMREGIDTHEAYILWSAKTLEAAMTYCMFASGHTSSLKEQEVFISLVSEHLAFVKEVEPIGNGNGLLHMSNKILEEGKPIAKGGALLYMNQDSLLRYVYIIDFKQIYKINSVTSK